MVQEVRFNGVQDLAQTGDIEEIIHVNDAHATAVIEAGDLDPWSKEAIFLYWCVFVTSVCACATGYVSHVSLIQLSVFQYLIGCHYHVSLAFLLVFSSYPPSCIPTLSFRIGINGMRAFIDRFTNGANLGEGVSILSSGVFNIKLALVHHKTQRPALSSPCTASVIWSVLSLLPLARITSFLHCVLRDQPYHTFRDRFGRRAAMFVGGVIICIGTAVMSTSALANQFIAGRFIVGFGISFMITAGPTYVAEIAPPQWRGRFTGSSNCEFILRSIARLH